MTTQLETPMWIRIDAPDGPSAFALEQRLAHLHPSAVGRGENWCVELEDFEDRREEIDAGIRHWLRAVGVRSTTVHANGVATTITAEPLVESALAAGYDGPDVLEHEP